MAEIKFSEVLDRIIDKSWELQNRIEDRFKHMGKGKYGRVIKMARKPDYDEYIKTIAITGAGILFVGGLGFSIYYLWNHAPDWISSLFGL